MPYTRNTRIKVITKKNSKEWIPQVEFRLPLLDPSWWQDFEDSCPIVEFLGKRIKNVFGIKT